MAQYNITTWHVDAIMKLRSVERRTLPSAFHEARKQAYDVLEAFGKLDTIAAHRIVAEIENAADLMPVGTQRTFNISNTGRTITIGREA